MTDSLLQIIITSTVTGLISTGATVVALKVHIMYLRERVAIMQTSIDAAHKRIDDITQGANHHNLRFPID